jgi:hypothetical protein
MKVVMPMSGALWLAAAAVIVTAVALVWVMRTRTNSRRLDVGSVSTQWVVEHWVGSETSVSR